MKLKITVVVLSVAISACSKSGPSRSEPSQRLDGSLSSNLEQIQRGEWASDCDKANSSLRLQIARDLDDRQSLIETGLKSKSGDSGYLNKVAAGPIELYDVEEKSVPDKWETESQSWVKAEEFYGKLNSSSPIEYWARLNAMVRSVIMLDKDRAVDAYGYAFGRSDEAMLTNTLNLAVACERDSSCSTITIDSNARASLDREPYFKYHIYHMQNDSSASSKRNSLTKMIDGLKSQVERLAGWKSRAVERLDSQTLGVRVYGDVFGAATSVISSILENAWQLGGSKIKVQWQNSFSANVFRFLIDLAVGERAYVAKREGEIHLSTLARKKSLIHEFGHVMGLPDQYSEVWQPSSCSYLVEYNASNIMSDSQTGKVLPEHFEKLKKLY